MKMNNKYKIGIVGLGYVGLPLAVEFGKQYETIGYDISKTRIENLKNKVDETLEISFDEIKSSKFLSFTDNDTSLSSCNIFIITVPTPIYKNKKPKLEFLEKASLTVGRLLKKRDIVIYESTVYPGATEEICIPILQKESKLNFNTDFFCGYSPERINPGDKNHRLKDIVKITSGSNKITSKKIDDLYKSIIIAGTCPVSSIKVAEAAKIIENTQRDVNIALINELSIIFNLLNIDTFEVLEAAKTKWNFLPFSPGLVGGHCIGVDPYYLTYKSKLIGYDPKIILAGRKINDNVAKNIYKKVRRLMNINNINVKKPKILILGLTFKENCPDTRNSLVFDLIKLFSKSGFGIDVKDPYIKNLNNSNKRKYNIVNKPKKNQYHAILLAVGHDEFKKINISDLLAFGTKNCVIFDAKNILPKKFVDGSL